MSTPPLDTILYGQDPTARVVAVEPDLTKGTVTLYSRAEAGESRTTRPFVPWLLTQEERHLRRHDEQARGEGYRWRIDFDESGWQGFTEARRALRDEARRGGRLSERDAPVLDGAGLTLFKGMVSTIYGGCRSISRPRRSTPKRPSPESS